MKAIWPLKTPFFEVYYFCLSSVLTIAYTYPLVNNLSGMFYGLPWDSLGGIWNLWWLKFSYLHNLPTKVHSYIAYPFGRDFTNYPSAYLPDLIGFLLTYFTNEIATHNILRLISFPVLALTTYLLIHYLTNHRAVSAAMGLVYAFSPFHVIHNISHLANIYWLPLAILFLLKLLKEGGKNNSLLFGFFGGLTFLNNVYYAYFLGLLLPIFITAYLLHTYQNHTFSVFNLLTRFSGSFLVFFLIIFPMLYPMVNTVLENQDLKPAEIEPFTKPFADLFIFSAKPLDYFFPSKYNPFLGWLVPDLGMSPLKGHRYTEHTLYLGYSLIIIGMYTFLRSIGKAGKINCSRDDRGTIYLFLGVALVSAVLSAPPFIPLGDYQINFQTREVIAEYKFYLPQYFLFQLFPMFRVYARIGAIVLLAVCILCSFGLREILLKFNSRTGPYLLLGVFSLLVFIEFAEYPSFRLTKVQEPEVYKWLAAQPQQFPIVEYPLGAGDDPYTTYEYYFYQRIHGKYLVNGATEGTPADDFRKKLLDPSRVETIDQLSKLGVKYVIIHKDKYVKGNEYVPMDWLTQPPQDKIFPVEYNDGKVPTVPTERLRLIKDFGDVIVYEPHESIQ